jgi:hypothetical protein
MVLSEVRMGISMAAIRMELHSKIKHLFTRGTDMSVSIEVENGKTFQISAILPKAELALKPILGLTYKPTVIVDFVFTTDFVWTTEREINLQDSIWIRPGMREALTVKLSGELAEASVHSREEVDYFAIIPEKWWAAALGAAVAIAIAELSASEVHDTGSIYTLKEYSKPDEFMQSIKVDKVFDDINEATEYFFFRLPGSAK